MLREGRDVAIIANGTMVARALEAADLLAASGIAARVINMASIAPLDEEAIRAAADLGAIVTVEEHSVRGGSRRRGGGNRRRLSALPGPYPRLPRLLADRFGRVPVREIWPHRRRHRARRARGDGFAAHGMSAHVLAIDQGTTNTKALGAGCGRPHRGTPLRADAGALSAARLGRAIGRRDLARDDVRRSTAALAPAGPSEIAAVAIANQRESVLLWRRSTGEPIGPCVTWQCRRSSDRIDAIRIPATEETVAATTGLGLDPLFPAAKIGWLLDAFPRPARSRTRRPLRRDGRFLAPVQPHRRRGPRHRRQQRLAHPALRHPRAVLERRPLRPVRRANRDPAARR